MDEKNKCGSSSSGSCNILFRSEGGKSFFFGGGESFFLIGDFFFVGVCEKKSLLK
jgi:hypothetical protein